MRSPSPDPAPAADRHPSRGAVGEWASKAVIPLFSLTILTSATLLFWVQPMFTRMVLPALGGTPGVWNTALVFFQAVLLAGYGYAHWLGGLSSLRAQKLVHGALLCAAFVVLPVSVATGWTPPTQGLPTPWLLGLFAASIGLPFFALSANAPLLQRWFSRTGHARSSSPWFLYAASNVGSIAALLSYPLLVEPGLGLTRQGLWWTGGYAVLTALILACMVLVGRGGHATLRTDDAALPTDGPAGSLWRQRLRWTVLSLVPSSLLLGVTTHLTTDVAAVPLAWIVPLVLYLLTFVLVFAERPPLPRRAILSLHAGATVLLCLLMYVAAMPPALMIPLHLVAFFAAAMVCHGELAASRPGVARLTEFYLWMSFGGVLGGAFNALLAPTLFDAVYEYPLALVAACLLRPVLDEGRGGTVRADLLRPLALGVATVAGYWLVGRIDLEPDALKLVGAVWMGLCALVVFGFSIRPLRFALGIGFGLVAMFVLDGDGVDVVMRERSFFGAHSVEVDETADVILLRHGTTVHGVQSRDPALALEPLAYYTREGPVGQAFEALREGERKPLSVGIVGLGAGASLCYSLPGERWSVFEIDPVVIDIARDERLFRYVEDCGADARFVLGDARLSLVHEPAGAFDLLLLDAFSSDSIPVSLLTAEAFELYFDRIGDGGALLVHVSNRYLDLEPVLAAAADEAGRTARIQLHWPRPRDGARPDPLDGYRFASEWIVLARDEASLGSLLDDPRWRPLRREPGLRAWTDDYSDLVRIVNWRGDPDAP